VLVSSSIFDNASDVGLLVGVATPPARRWHAGLAAGVGAAQAPDGTHGVGLPLEAQVSWRFSKIVGLGLYGFGDLNGAADFGGVTLALHVGRFR
jgi:hypothetical protein